jgi:hypothetical protein
VGAVVGSIDAPTAIVAGLYQNNGTLRMVRNCQDLWIKIF